MLSELKITHCEASDSYDRMFIKPQNINRRHFAWCRGGNKISRGNVWMSLLGMHGQNHTEMLINPPFLRAIAQNISGSAFSLIFLLHREAGLPRMRAT